MPTLLIYEDYEHRNLAPISLCRPIHEITCGIHSLGEAILAIFPHTKQQYLIREHLQSLYPAEKILTAESLAKADDHEEYFCLKANIIYHKAFELDIQQMACIENECIAFRVKKNDLKKIYKCFFNKEAMQSQIQQARLHKKEIQGTHIRYYCDLIKHNTALLTEHIKQKQRDPQPDTHHQTIGPPEDLHISPSARIDPGVHFTTESGPIFIDSGSHIKPLTHIEGPCYIGKNNIIHRSSIHASTILDHCKISGEISHSILTSYINKTHEGYIGHSYICPFVNFGALTTTSNLKNNRSSIRIHINGQIIDTNQEKLGACIGDYTALAAGTYINTGSIIGFGCNIFSTKTNSQKNIPSFSWGGESSQKRNLDKFITTVLRIWHRKGIRDNKTLLQIYTTLYESAK